jgi:epoxyqueuosine reductase QueG
MSLGEDRVRTKFNPSNSSAVDMLKQTAAKFIDQCEALKIEATGNGEALRCIALAQTHAEDAAMWAVKAATAETKKAGAKAA